MATNNKIGVKEGYQYFPGCCMHGFGASSGESVKAVFRLLGLPLAELEDWNCCGATSYFSIDENSAFVLAARNLSLAGRDGRDLVAPCSGCFLALRKTQEYFEHYPAIRQHVTGALASAGLPAPGPVRVRHPLEVLYNDVGLAQLRSRVKRQWRGGNVACYYGCQAVRPYSEPDKAHDPMRLDEMMEAIGVHTVEYPLKTKCCGGSLTGTMHPVGVRLNYILLKEALRRGAQAIVTICPLCQLNLDMYQAEISRDTPESMDIPILYFTQLLGWALGAELRELGLRRAVSGTAQIERWLYAEKEVEAYV